MDRKCRWFHNFKIQHYLLKNLCWSNSERCSIQSLANLPSPRTNSLISGHTFATRLEAVWEDAVTIEQTVGASVCFVYTLLVVPRPQPVLFSGCHLAAWVFLIAVAFSVSIDRPLHTRCCFNFPLHKQTINFLMQSEKKPIPIKRSEKFNPLKEFVLLLELFVKSKSTAISPYMKALGKSLTRSAALYHFPRYYSSASQIYLS